MRDPNIDDHDHLEVKWGVSVPVGSIQGGQSIDILKRVRVAKGFSGRLFTATLKCRQSSVNHDDPFLSVSTECAFQRNAPLPVDDREEIDAQRFRNYIIVMVKEILGMLNSVQTLEPIQEMLSPRLREIKEWVDNNRATGPGPTARRRIADIYADLSGQVLESISSMEYVNKWTRHYLPSLSCAHSLQQCNNFKVKMNNMAKYAFFL